MVMEGAEALGVPQIISVIKGQSIISIVIIIIITLLCIMI
jgi:hypothetical protein